MAKARVKTRILAVKRGVVRAGIALPPPRHRYAGGFTHLLWIRLCATNLTLGKSIDSKGKFLTAQKAGNSGNVAPTSSLKIVPRYFLEAPMFCTPSVDKIVRKHFDSR
jgi:hypothetical protein